VAKPDRVPQLRRRSALALAALALLLWAAALPLWTLRLLLLSPSFYRGWVQASDLTGLLGAQLARDLPRHIPADAWSPWVPRAPARLRALFDYAWGLADVERGAMRLGPSWARWGLGEASLPRSLAAELVAYLEGPRGENVRAFLWQSLPPCPPAEDAEPRYCMPADPGARPAVGQTQRAWWAAFVDELVAWATATEAQVLARWAGPPAWMRWLWYAPLAALGLALLAFAVAPARGRWLCLGVPLAGGGALTAALGAVGWAGWIAAPDVLAWIDAPASIALAALFPPLWDTFVQLAGPALVVTGGSALTVGALLATFAVRRTPERLLVVAAALLLAAGTGYVWPSAPYAALSPSMAPPALFGPTPTPWPTLTATPTATPTPYYWPVTPGTPLPTASSVTAWDAARWSSAQLLGCSAVDAAPVLALDVVAGEIRAFQRAGMTRQHLATLATFARASSPLTLTTWALAPTGQEAALAQGRDLYVYALPGWTPALRSRVSTFSRIQSAIYLHGRDRVALGLENGVLWGVEPATGAIAWLIPAHDVPITALAAHPTRPWVLSGSDEGTLRLWDVDASEELTVLQGHSGAVRRIFMAPDGATALSLDARDTLILWDLAAGQVLVRRELDASEVPTALAWTRAGRFVGTAQGKVGLLDAELRRRDGHAVFDAPVTALTLAPPGYVLAGSTEGQVCVWGALDVP
jgi:hypothetical protein